ncbi:MAG: hypothetical protein CMB45_05055 [Euryarchaeota archaeon]|nr:hypothetical protein [Euryarchaeota archaeon]|tara:strand:- start:15661 stop:15933 length:273 start_codon:yes stop_codon:yes gene_type:complete
MRVKRVQQSTPLLVDETDDCLVAPTRCREELQLMLADAIERRDQWYNYWDKTKLSRKQNVEALRNYTALRGVVKTLQWVLMHPDIEHPLD